MPRRSATLPAGLQIGTALGVMFAVALLAGWDARTRAHHVLAVSANYGVTVENPSTAPAEPTGYAMGRRSQVLPPAAADTAHWIMQAQAALAAGDWRVRRVDYDNAPEGREVHWAAPLRWWLIGLAWIDHKVSGRPIGQSVERAVIYSGPAMFGLIFAGIGFLLFRGFGPLPAALFALGVPAVHPFYLDFVVGYADHHGLANLCGLLTVLCLAAGFFAAEIAAVRRWFIASAIAGGSGLWISAATQAPVLLGLGPGLLVAMALARVANPAPAWIAQPGLLRVWGWVGGATSLAAWLFEYFPGHLGMRLEVNHPLYAAAWMGAGEALRVVALAARGGWAAVPGSERVRGLVGAGLVGLLPLVIAMTSARTFLVVDPFLWRLHAQYIAEFQRLAQILRRGLSWNLAALCLPALMLAPALWSIFQDKVPAARRAQFALVLLPALLGWCMGCAQIRWLGLAFALSVPVMAVFFRAGDGERERPRAWFLGWLVVGALMFGPGLASAIQRTRAAGDSTTDDIRNLAMRDVAHWLRLHGGKEAAVVAASPGVATQLIYFGGLRGLGTLYWENIGGLKRAAKFYAATTPDEAMELAARLGVTHVVYVSWAPFEPRLVRLHRGLSEETPLPEDTLFVQLLRAPVPPPWLRAVPFKLPKHPALEGEQVRIWEVVPAQSPATALAWATNYYLELGLMEQAASLAPALMRHENDLRAMVMLAAIASRDQDREGFAAVFGRVRAQLAQAGALALDEHVHLVVVLAVGQRPDLAQAQLHAAMQKVDAASIRRLTLGTLNDLLALSETLKVPLPSPELQQLAAGLMPPGQRTENR